MVLKKFSLNEFSYTWFKTENYLLHI